MSAPRTDHHDALRRLRSLAFHVISSGADVMEIEESLTSDLDAAIAVASSAGLTPEARRLHGLPPLPPVPERWRGVPLRRLQAERDRLLRAWNQALADAEYHADKRVELAAAPDAGAAADAVSRWGLLDGRRMPRPLPSADPPFMLFMADQATVLGAVGGHVSRFFFHANPHTKPPRVLLNAETGSRKTGIALREYRRWMKRRNAAGLPHRGILHVPAHKLGAELLERAKAEGINAAVFRGRGDAERERLGEPQPCRNLEAVSLARQAGANIRAVVCGPAPGGNRCAWRDSCEYFASLKQASAADLVIVAHNFLFEPLPEELLHDLGAVIVDEDFATLADRIFNLSLGTMSQDMINAFPPRDEEGEPDTAATAELHRLREVLTEAARACLGGYLTADGLRAVGLTVDTAARMRELHWRRKVPVEMRPGMEMEDRREAARAARVNAQLPGIHALTHALEAILTEGGTAAGRVSVRLDTRHGDIALTVRGQRAPAKWLQDLPVLMLNATGRIEDVWRVFPGGELADVPRAAWPHVEVHQVIGGFGRSTLARNKRRLDELRDFILLQTMGRQNALVVTHKPHIDAFAGIPGVATAHHGAIAGSDLHADVDAAFIIGGAFASPDEIASTAAARGGGAVSVAKPEPVKRAALLTSGAAVEIDVLAYADPAADAVHRGIYDASIVQAVGRLRPLNRTAANPAKAFIFVNAALPFPVAGVTRWQDIKPDRIARMVAQGAVWTNAADMHVFRPDLFRSAAAAEIARRRCIKTLAGLRMVVREIVRHDTRAWNQIQFQPAGQGQRKRAVYVPAGSETAIRAAIEAQYGTPVFWWVRRLTSGGPEEADMSGISGTFPGMSASSAMPSAETTVMAPLGAAALPHLPDG